MAGVRRAVAVAGFAASALLVVLPTPAAALFNNGSVIAPCNSTLYCYGDMLKQIQLAAPFSDSKTFVDMPTVRPLDEVVAAFANLTKPLTNNTALNNFLATYFAPAGGELESVPPDQLIINATFLGSVHDTVIYQFVQKVIAIWPDLTRRYTGSSGSSGSSNNATGATNCTGCQSSFVPVNRTFVVAGGRFREPYYWDSYWIVEGLLRTGGSFVNITRNTIENFLDLIDQFGFVPNGARVYYLNRSQPPLLSQMVRVYLEHTNDTSILDRAVPLLIKEHAFWTTNRSVSVTAADNKTYTLNRYSVLNNQPRPESYLEDYVTVNNQSYYAANGSVYKAPQPLNASQQAALYAQLASGAESGWDYGTRWLARPNDSVTDTYFPLRSLNINNLVPVDLNSILYWNEVTIGAFLNTTGNATAAATWAETARNRSAAMYAVLWNETLFSYFDYNTSAQAQNIYVPRDADATAAADDTDTAPPGYQVLFDIAQLYPFWTGAAPARLKNDPLAVKLAYARVDAYLAANAGGVPATNLQTGQQWDQPNVWPPLQHVLMQGLLNTPPTFGTNDSDYQAVQSLALRLGQRYLDSTFCTWYATGGATTETPQLPGFTPAANGTIFEKYTDNATNGAGSGGEYTVVEGFGWSNGVLLWTVDTFRNQLTRPDCGNITAANITPGKRSVEAEGGDGGGGLARRARPPSAVQLDPYDAKWIKMFGSRSRDEE
ncbi:trehalase precursor [Niveomyces insectorum RCEF 264]|uniref:Trehalase n=1 Tax=Niveomyces insectorum RCEF 264 TaxID=1081102 RepID=A0A167VGR1_9HYPO|nr:trehalase precursor [Niveomyces insectorum RCEF 264]